MKRVLQLVLMTVIGGAQWYPAYSQAADTPPVPAVAGPAQLGKWITESGNLEVDIEPCGAALCGSVTRVISNRAMGGPGSDTPKTDAPSLNGLKILSDFQPAGDGKWEGKIYNRDKDKTYDCLMELQGQNELKIRGYKFFPIFGSTQIWRRVHPR
jgi:uncharacterized protein (DUF2147 family)